MLAYIFRLIYQHFCKRYFADLRKCRRLGARWADERYPRRGPQESRWCAFGLRAVMCAGRSRAHGAPAAGGRQIA